MMISSNVSSVLALPQGRLWSVAAPDASPAGSSDVATLTARVEVLHKRAERLHGAADAIGLFTFFGMPVYAIPCFMVANALFPGAGEAGAVLAGVMGAGACVGASLYVNKKGNDVRHEAEAINKQIPGAQPLDWSWSGR